MATGFYQPTVNKAPSIKLPSFQSGANNLAAINPYTFQNTKNTSGYNEMSGGYQPTPANYGITGPVVGSQYPGQPGGITPTQAQTAATIPSAPAAPQLPGANSDADQQYMYKLMNDDPQLSGELDALAANNQAAWSSYLAQARQAEIAYGGAYNQQAGVALGYDPSSFKAGTIYNTIPGNTHPIGTPTGSLVDALSDPAMLASIAPGTGGYNVSALGQIANQFNTANRTVDANLRARGMYGSSSLGQHLNENLQSNQVAQNTALTNFLSALQSGYGSYMGGFGGLQSQQATDYQNELNTIISGIGNGVYTLPSVAAAQLAAAKAKAAATPPPAAPVDDQPRYNDYGGDIPPVAYGTTPPATPWSPYTTPVTANWSGGSANQHQGIFSIH